MKPILLLKSVAIMSAIAWSNAGLAEQSFDLNGLKLGQPYVDAKSKVATIDPSYKVSDVKTVDGTEVGFVAKNQMPGTKVGDELVVQRLDSGKVWYVGSMHTLPDGQRIDKDVFIKSLQEKYGSVGASYAGAASVLPGAPTFEMTWQYNRQGKRIGKSYAEMQCLENVSGAPLPNSTLFSPWKFNSTCGNVIIARGWQTGQFVWSYSVVIIDHASMYDQLQKANVAEQTKRNKAVDTEKLKGVKPVL